MIIVTYHRIADGDEEANRYCVPRSLLDSHLDVLRSSLLAPAAFFERALRRDRRRSSEVLLTVDDGFASDFDVFRARLVTGRIPGFVSFVCADRIGVPGFLSAAQIREMTRDGIVFGSHGVSHTPFVDLDERRLAAELRDSKRTLEDVTQQPVESVAFPFGRCGVRECRAAFAAGYRFLFGGDGGFHPGWQPALFNRTSIERGTAAEELRRLIADPIAFLPLRQRPLARLGVLQSVRALRRRWPRRR